MIYAKSLRAPSYFSKFFEEQLRQNEDSSGGVRTLYIDRDPATFHDICRHLQGNSAQPCIKHRGTDLDLKVISYNPKTALTTSDCLQMHSSTHVRFIPW